MRKLCINHYSCWRILQFSMVNNMKWSPPLDKICCLDKWILLTFIIICLILLAFGLVVNHLMTEIQEK